MLSKNQIQEYHARGFLCVPDFLSPKLIDTFLETADEIVSSNARNDYDSARVEMEPDQSPSGTKVRRIYEPCEYYEPYRSYSDSPEVLNVVEQLIGHNIYLHYSKLNMKPAELGSVVDWHQDLSYFPSTNGDSLAILIYLDDADLENGCLMALPKRHENDLMDHTSSGIFQGRITETIAESDAELLPGKAGTAIILHCLTPHASRPNLSERQRRTLIISYRATDSFPIFVDNRTIEVEKYLRLVRGKAADSARMEFKSFPIPVYRGKEASLYDLQAASREGKL
jgi:ectoine hydroxylase-related dioxygenase (phytanoyl-CoA dioxygenase family)